MSNPTEGKSEFFRPERVGPHVVGPAHLAEGKLLGPAGQAEWAKEQLQSRRIEKKEKGAWLDKKKDEAKKKEETERKEEEWRDHIRSLKRNPYDDHFPSRNTPSPEVNPDTECMFQIDIDNPIPTNTLFPPKLFPPSHPPSHPPPHFKRPCQETLH